jgi:hypothetical protein
MTSTRDDEAPLWWWDPNPHPTPARRPKPPDIPPGKVRLSIYSGRTVIANLEAWGWHGEEDGWRGACRFELAGTTHSGTYLPDQIRALDEPSTPG